MEIAQNLGTVEKNAFDDKFAFTGQSLGGVVTALLPYVFSAVGILILLYLLAGGFQLMFAAGDPKRVQGAWNKITNALIGFVIVFLAYWITKLVGTILNIPAITDIFK